MAIFHSSKLIAATESAIPAMEQNIVNYFTGEGYECSSAPLCGGGRQVSVTKGGIFRAILGLRTALDIRLRPQNNGVLVDAGVGIFGQQVIPTMITLFVTWPVLLTQIWGLIKQSKLDDTAINLAEQAVTTKQKCPHCGASMISGTSFCTICGSRLTA